MFNMKTARFYWCNRPHSWVVVPSIGSAGGIVLLWDSEKTEVLSVLKGNYLVSIQKIYLLEGITSSWQALICPSAIVQRFLFHSVS